VIDRLHKLGHDVKTASSSVDEDTAEKLKRALRIDAITATKKRVYGSDEDEAEREAEREALEAKVAAEREERERAAAEAAAAAEARKHKRGRASKAEAEKAKAEADAALIHPPGAPRLAPRLAPAPAAAPAGEEVAEEPEAAPEPVEVPEPEPEVAAEPPVPVAPAAPPTPAEPIVVRPIAPVPPAATAPPQAQAAAVAPEPEAPAPEPSPAPAAAPPPPPATRPRLGPVRPIAPPAPVAPPPPPPAPAAAAPALPRPVAPILPKPLRPIAPARPVSPHATGVAGPGGARPQHPTTPPGRVTYPSRPGAGPSPYPSRPGAPPPSSLRPQRPATSRSRDRSKSTPPPQVEARAAYTGPLRPLTLSEGVTVKELSEKMSDVKNRDIMKALLTRGLMVTVNATLDPKLAIEICREFGYDAKVETFEAEIIAEAKEKDRPEDLVPRAPVVTVMGHVDHGKTSLLDAIRETSVAAGEAGGITQHIGAYHVNVGDRKVVFLDTPGHEAFTLMRARGARVTDVVVLVVAADDGVMPQTVEAIDHARAAGVPIVVAVNKIDKPEAQPDRVKQQLSDKGLMPEDWGGTTVFVQVSAKKRQNLEQLLEMLLLVADMQELKGNPKKPGLGTVLEARLDKGRGAVATVLIQDGTLEMGDTVVAGAVKGKVRALVDDQGARLKKAGPATPVEILGLEAVPEPGDPLLVVEDAAKAQQIVAFRQLKLREKTMAASSRIRLEDLGRKIAEGQIKELPLVVKADVQGSVEAVCDQLMKIPQEKIKLRIIRSGAGAITESDVLLAAASDAVVIGFNVRPEKKAVEAADRDEVELRLYTVIYDAVEDMRKALEGMLEPTIREVRLGAAEVLETFRISKVGTIAGCRVSDGKVVRTAHVRLLRDNVVIHTGKVASLKRFKDDAAEVRAGNECGIGIAGYNDLKPGDEIEFFTTEKVKETLA
jgi:translation initiation factor IF-2